MKYIVHLSNYYTLRPNENCLVEFKDDKITPVFSRTIVVDAENELDASMKAQKMAKITSKNFFMEIETCEPLSETSQKTSKALE